jgi:two-component system, LytTR family, response regulator
MGTRLRSNTAIGLQEAQMSAFASQLDSLTIGQKNPPEHPMTSQIPIRTLIVDDEPHARRYIAELLQDEAKISLVGEASDGEEGLDLIRNCEPDLVFLDVQMPDLDGFAMHAHLRSDKLPAFVFVTGYSEYAAKAFDIEAVDYLCKPFDKERLCTAVERVARRLSISSASPGPSQRTLRQRWLSRIAVKDQDGTTFVPVEQILWIESANRYVIIHTAAKDFITRETMQNLEEALNPAQFIRIHRGTLARKSAIRGLQPLFHGDYTVTLVNGAQLTLSRTFRTAFFKQMRY